MGAGRIITGAQTLTPGWVEITAGVLTAVGAGPPPRLPDRDLGAAATVIPGMVDMHTHGGGGHDMTNGDPAAVRSALAWSARHGITASVLSTVAAPLDRLADIIAIAADVMAGQRDPALPVSSTRLLGVHLEGPFLSVARRGAHQQEALLLPRAADVHRLLAVAPGAVAMVTLAPELDGALTAIAAIRDAGAVAAIGHTDADADRTAAAVAAGARVGTHLFNGMRGLHHRDPGPVGALLVADDVVCELINDGRHLDRRIVALAHRAAGTGRIALISDGVAATGAPDGEYRLGPVTVVHRAGEVRVADPDAPDGLGSLGGGELALDAALRRAVRVVGLPLTDAVAAVTTTPARALGVAGRVGSIAVGRDADLCVLDEDLAVTNICLAGCWLD